MVRGCLLVACNIRRPNLQGRFACTISADGAAFLVMAPAVSLPCIISCNPDYRDEAVTEGSGLQLPLPNSHFNGEMEIGNLPVLEDPWKSACIGQGILLGSISGIHNLSLLQHLRRRSDVYVLVSQISSRM